MIKKILSLFLVFAIAFSMSTTAFAADVDFDDFVSGMCTFGEWATQQTMFAVQLIGSAFDDDICPSGSVDDTHDLEIRRTTFDGTVGNYYVCSKCGFNTGVTFESAYSTYVSTLDSEYGTDVFTSSGLPIYYPTWTCTPNENFFTLVDLTSANGAFSISYYCHKKYGSGGIGVQTNPFFLPAGSYTLHFGEFIWDGSTASDPYYYLHTDTAVGNSLPYGSTLDPVNFHISTAGTVYLTFSYRDLYISYDKTYTFSGSCYVVPLFAPDDVPGSTTRTASLMQTINNFNNDNSYTDNSTTVNYFIGSLGDDGSVTDVYSPALYDEETLIFTEPISGTQYQTTGWTYDYTTRSYDLTLASGTMTVADTDITQVICTYGDDAVTISYCDSSGAAVQTDEFAYVMASQSECNINGHTYNVETTKEPTCTAAGERTYTCSICGNQYVEEISKTDHTYADYTITQEPTCTAGGIVSYTCSTCGAQITEKLDALGHDWLASEVTETTYEVPEGTSCPNCSGTAFTHTRSGDIYTCTCSDCGTEWSVNAVITYGSTTYTCSRCGETYVESEDPDSGLFAALANFLSDGITWVTGKFTELAESINSIHTTFRSYLQKIQNVGGDFPAFLSAAVGIMPEDFMAVVWFSIVALVILAVWLKFFK